MIYCIVPEGLALELHDVLRTHFRGNRRVEVVVERRQAERRGPERRHETAQAADDRRRQARRKAERRAPLIAVAAPHDLPYEVQPYRGCLRFLRAADMSDLAAEDRDSAALVRQFQAGSEDAFSELYLRYFDRIYAYMRVALADNHGAEDATQQVFIRLYEALPRYEDRGQPFRAFLFVVARNHAVSELRRRRRLDPVDPVELDRRLEPLEASAGEVPWVSDRELLMLVERLPIAQRQVLVLRFMLDLTHAQIGQVLDRTPEDVRALQYRALGFMRGRLAAMGRGGTVQRMPMQRRPELEPVAVARRAALI